MAESVIKKDVYTDMTYVSLTPEEIPANSSKTFYDTNHKSVPVVGYVFYGLGSANVVVTQCFSSTDGITLTVRNHSSFSVTPTAIRVYILT